MDTYEAVLEQRAGRLTFRNARRRQESILAEVEKRALIWMANRTPRQINSDHLTLLGLASMFLAGVSYALCPYTRWGLLFASIFIALNWIGDSMDGTLARVRDQQRPRYGFYVDHIIDSFGACFLLGGLALSGYMSVSIAVGLLIAFLMLSIETYLATYTIGDFRLSHFKFSPTELRLLLIAGNVALIWRPWVHFAGGHFRLFDVGGAIGIVGMLVILLVATIRNTRRLYREETLAKDDWGGRL